MQWEPELLILQSRLQLNHSNYFFSRKLLKKKRLLREKWSLSFTNCWNESIRACQGQNWSVLYSFKAALTSKTRLKSLGFKTAAVRKCKDGWSEKWNSVKWKKSGLFTWKLNKKLNKNKRKCDLKFSRTVKSVSLELILKDLL